MSDDKTGIAVKRALISVFDKSGLDGIVRCLAEYKVEIISSGGTAKAIRAMGITCVDVSDYTGYPESPDGLVKTLQPKIHGGLLLDATNPSHAEFMTKHGIMPIDIVIVNLYPFLKVISTPGTIPVQAYEMIDIGGPAMIRASAKGALLHGRPCVIVDPEDYSAVIAELNKHPGHLPATFVHTLAVKAFKHTAGYDMEIVKYLDK
jgi:phosphoribosylaminoimidazolecarboxamide formyltransferase/IMP cyclohydrolase